MYSYYISRVCFGMSIPLWRYPKQLLMPLTSCSIASLACVKARPDSYFVTPDKSGDRIIPVPILGGLHHERMRQVAMADGCGSTIGVGSDPLLHFYSILGTRTGTGHRLTSNGPLDENVHGRYASRMPCGSHSCSQRTWLRRFIRYKPLEAGASSPNTSRCRTTTPRC